MQRVDAPAESNLGKRLGKITETLRGMDENERVKFLNVGSKKAIESEGIEEFEAIFNSAEITFSQTKSTEPIEITSHDNVDALVDAIFKKQNAIKQDARAKILLSNDKLLAALIASDIKVKIGEKKYSASRILKKLMQKCDKEPDTMMSLAFKKQLASIETRIKTYVDQKAKDSVNRSIGYSKNTLEASLAQYKTNRDAGLHIGGYKSKMAALSWLEAYLTSGDVTIDRDSREHLDALSEGDLGEAIRKWVEKNPNANVILPEALYRRVINKRNENDIKIKDEIAFLRYELNQLSDEQRKSASVQRLLNLRAADISNLADYRRMLMEEHRASLEYKRPQTAILAIC